MPNVANPPLVETAEQESLVIVRKAIYGKPLNKTEQKTVSVAALLFQLHTLMQEYLDSAYATRRQDLLTAQVEKLDAHVTKMLSVKHLSAFAPLITSIGASALKFEENHIKTLIEIATPLSSTLSAAAGAKHDRGLDSAGQNYNWALSARDDSSARMRTLESDIKTLLSQLLQILQQEVADFRS